MLLGVPVSWHFEECPVTMWVLFFSAAMKTTQVAQPERPSWGQSFPDLVIAEGNGRGECGRQGGARRAWFRQAFA